MTFIYRATGSKWQIYLNRIKIPAPRGGVLILEIPHGSLTFDNEKNAASGGEYTRRDLTYMLSVALL
jgi:hypothetical protein